MPTLTPSRGAGDYVIRKDVDGLSKASHLPIAAYFNILSLPSPSTLRNTKASYEKALYKLFLNSLLSDCLIPFLQEANMSAEPHTESKAKTKVNLK